MKILIAISNRSMGGAQRVAMHLCEWLNEQPKIDACVVSLATCNGKKYDMENIKVYDIENKKKIKSLVKIIKDYCPNVVISMGVPMTIYTVPACVLTKTKHIVSERNDPRHFAGKRITKIVSRIMMKKANGFVFQTGDALEFYRSKLRNKKVTVIANPIFNTNKMPDKPYFGERNKNVVSVGRLNKQKNQELLIEAFSKVNTVLPEYTLTIWGEGIERQALQKQIDNYNLQGVVKLPGNTDKIFDKIYKESVFVLSSDFEGMPNALMEAMALGLPCISTDCPCGGPRELINNGENGYLIEVSDKERLADLILMLLKNPSKAKEIGQKAFDIRKKYTIDNICSSWLSFIKEV